MGVVALIPAYNPDGQLPAVVDALAERGFTEIVVVDDGSDARCRPVFERLAAGGRCRVLAHAVNLGKGRALKTGLNQIALAHPGAAGVVTLDADGQHPAEDVARVVAAFLRDPRDLVIGSRRFAAGTPLRSLVGNLLTRWLFRLLAGRRVADTQSGLRCFPLALVPWLLQLEGERFEYEMNVLIAARGAGVRVREEPIPAVYLEGNRSSHFDPLLDSMRVSFLLLRFTLSSAFASLIDFLLFFVSISLGKGVLASIVVARLIAGTVNFFVNRRVVFRSRRRLRVTLARYYLLLALLGALAYLAIGALGRAGVNVILAKAVAETLLFVASFSIQRDFIFGDRADR